MRKITAYVQKEHTKMTPLNKLRLKRNLTVTAIAKQMGISIGTASIILNKDEIPSKKNLTKLAQIFNMEYADLCKELNADPETVFDKKLRYNNFWTRTKEESGLTLNEIAEGIGKKNNYRTVGKYFTGELMPKDATIRAICNLFDVEFEQGKEEFKKAVNTWKSEKSEKSEKVSKDNSANKKLPAENPVAVTPKRPMVIQKDNRTLTPTKSVPANTKPEKQIDTTNIESLIYGKVNYDEFEAVKAQLRKPSTNGSPLEAIYGKVDCDTYNKVYDLIKS